MATAISSFIIGRQEWIGLPELGLPAIKAKVDTGARTSALHAFLIEPYGPADAPMVRFGVHPVPGRHDIAVMCEAPIVDRREVTSSNGESETRFIIRTPVLLGERRWSIEIGLTNRESMTYRMLLGRQAIRDDMIVDVAVSFHQQRLSYKAYRGLPRAKVTERSLRLALVAAGSDTAFANRLTRAATRRGHSLRAISLDRLQLTFDPQRPGLTLDGVPLAQIDGVVPRIGRKEGPHGAAVIRQLEVTGAFSLNSGDAIERAASRLATAQTLVLRGVPQVLVTEDHAFDRVGRSETLLRALVVGSEVVAMVAVSGGASEHAGLSRHRAECRLAQHAAAALGLGLATIDVVRGQDGLAVARVSTRPILSRFGGPKLDLGEEIIAALEASLAGLRRGYRLDGGMN